MSAAALECTHLSRWYGEVIALNDVTVDVPEGITGLLGPNGAGKSTLIRLAMGLIRPNQGAIQVLGEDPWDNPELLRRIGYVPEGQPPWRNKTGFNCLLYGARLSGHARADAENAAREALARVELTDAGDRRVDTYSHGMQQRLKFALALMHDPQLLILDEPLAGTDPVARHHLLDLMRRVASEGRSVLISTHVLKDVEHLTQRILLLNHGRMLAHGGVHEIRDLLDRHPRHVRIATRDPRALGAELWRWDSVLSLEVSEHAVLVRTGSPATFYEQLQQHLRSGRTQFTSVTSPDDTVEAVFRYLVG